MNNILDFRKPRPKKPPGKKQPPNVKLFAAIVIALGIAASLYFSPGEIARLSPVPQAARYGLCHTGGGRNCVVDGDTFWMDGVNIRVADIDAPETHPSRCPREEELGRRATLRLQELLNRGPVTLAATDRDEDTYGRKLRIVLQGGKSVGQSLVDEGLARRWTGSQQPWC